MNFAPIDLDARHHALRDDVRACLEAVVTEEVELDEYRVGHGHDWRVHRALGARGWLYPEWPVDEGGAGLDTLSSVIVAYELERAHVPGRGQRTTSMVVGVVRMHGSDALRDEVLLRAARGDIIMCLGWTEPESGSDVAAASCRATRDGDDWVINGQKLFTSGGDEAAYTFLLTRSDTGAPKHRGLTTFLVPLDLAGIEIQAMRTIGGERTTIVFYDDVRIPDHYRLGAVNDGWSVLSTALAQEHGENREAAMGEVGAYHRHLCDALVDAVAWARSANRPDGSLPIEDPLVRRRLARAALRVVVAGEAPVGLSMRVLGSTVLVEGAPDLVDLVGPASLLERGARGALGSAHLEASYRVGPETTIYGGTTDIARSVIAERDLRLPRSRPHRG